MWKPIYQPEPWSQYLKKKEYIGVPLMEVRKKYMEEQLLFENYISYLQPLNTLSPISTPSSGGPVSIYPNTITVEFFDNGVSQGVSTYQKTLDISLRPIRRFIATIVAYRNTTAEVDCDYKTIFYEINEAQRPVLSGWYARDIPCGGKTNKLTGPTTTLPYGDYGQIVGIGEGYRVTP